MSADDEDLVALIDNELDESRRLRVLARIEAEPELAERYAALRKAREPIGPALDALLGQAPLAKLRASLPPEPAAAWERRGPRGFAWRELAAGVVAGLVAAGALAWLAVGFPRDEDSDWRGAVVDYMQLYTNDTFAFRTPDRETQAQELGAVGAKLGASLTPEGVALPGLDFRAAFILAYDHAPLGELAYVDSGGAPVLFCVTANGAADAPLKTESRDDFSLASWSRGGHSYLVIGRMPEARAADYARILQERG
jgi:anti-sigma factor RsiW